MTLAPTRTTLLLPGIVQLDAGFERYRVDGGGLTAVTMKGGDTLTVHDPEGRQCAEIAAFDTEGKSDPALLGAGPAQSAKGIQAILATRANGANRVAEQLSAAGVHIADSTAAVVLTGDTTPGSEATFTAQSDLVCLVAAVGDDMDVAASNPPTDLVMYVRRAKTPDKARHALPDPLGEARFEATISAATAMAYEVKQGEYIQIIDIEGRECSDFQSFDAAALDRGTERSLSGIGTRTALGLAYPGPGLYSKFFDQSMVPMVEVIQDTVGRHDTFAYACTSRYYEDMGYPGHANCTDNFNKELAPYNVAPRDGWEAINFFYNTNIDDNNQIYFEEPWSRPGDYVLLKALTDLVSVSSACPCDIDPANGWVPTDIHVRVYSEKELFRRSIAFRATTDAMPKPTKETAFHRRTSELTRNFSEYNGYWLPNEYRDWGAINEYWACRERAVLIDVSPLRKYEVLGPDAGALMQLGVTRNVTKLAVGQVTYTAMCYETGGMVDDGTVFRLADDRFRWVGGLDTSGLWLRQLAHERNMDVWVKDSTDQLHNLQVQGPLSRQIMEQIVWNPDDQPSIDKLGWFRFTLGRIGGEHGASVLISRTGYSGELGFEIFCHPDDGVAVWDALWEVGEPLGLAPLGMNAMDVVRIEAGLIFAGSEFTDQTDPFEAGIGFTVPLKSKPDYFIGRDAIAVRKEHPQRKLVGLEVAGGEPASPGEGVYHGRNQIGVITSGTRSPILRKNVALCRIAVQYGDEGTEVQVGKMDGHMKRIPATVVKTPFYDPEKKRVRASE